VANLLLDNLARRWGAGQAKLKTKDLMAQGEMSGGCYLYCYTYVCVCIRIAGASVDFLVVVAVLL
jgi:hypothetical protein